MNMETLQQVTDGIRRALEPAQRLLNRIYNWDMNEMFQLGGTQPPQDRKELEDWLTGELALVAKRIATYLELLGLEETQAQFLKGWDEVGPDYGHTEWWHTDEDDGLESKPLEYLNEMYRSLRLLVDPDEDAHVQPQEDPLLKQLENVLRATAQVLRNRGMVPRREHDIQTVMNQHLKTVFPDYVTNVVISKPITGFKPDGGVISLKSAIEFKFCDNEDDVKVALRGITEDISGYEGSLDWTRFYCVVYQTEAFINENRYQKSLKLSGNAEKWTFIVVTGGANRDGQPVGASDG